jgi:hypothetical protein
MNTYVFLKIATSFLITTFLFKKACYVYLFISDLYMFVLHKDVLSVVINILVLRGFNYKTRVGCRNTKL